MQAWCIRKYGVISDLELSQTTPPTPASGEILVRVQAAALNPADLKVISGKDGGKFLHAKQFPLTPGFDFSGFVEAIGPQEPGKKGKRLVKGMEVFGFLPYSTNTKQGSFSELLTARIDQVAQKATNTTHQEAAGAATAASTAYQALRDKGRLRPGQRVLIHGASGGVGSFAVQIAKILGATAWGTCSAPSRGFVKSLGAEEAIDYRTTQIKDLGEKFDIIFDVASVSSYGQCASSLAKGGTYITLLPSASLLTGKAASIFSSRSCKVVVVKPKAADLRQIADWLSSGQLSTLLDANYSFENLPAALARLEDGGVRGKVVLDVGR